MLQRTTHHMRHNVVAYLALFFALSGTAIAAKPLVTGEGVQDESLTGADVRNNSLTGEDILESSLGKVGDADTLDGRDSTGFLGAGAKAADADTLDGRDSASFLGSDKLRSASVNVDGSAARLSGFASSSRFGSGCDFHGGTDSGCSGMYFLALPGGVSSGSCTYTVTVGRTGISTAPGHYASTPGIATAHGIQQFDRDLVIVTTYNVDGVPQHLPCHLLAAC